MFTKEFSYFRNLFKCIESNRNRTPIFYAVYARLLHSSPLIVLTITLMTIMIDLIMNVSIQMTMVKMIMLMMMTIKRRHDLTIFRFRISIGSFLFSPQDKSPEKGRNSKMCKSVIRCFVSLFSLLHYYVHCNIDITDDILNIVCIVSGITNFNICILYFFP